ncbi:translocation/assembly module TamB [Avibacterium sp. 20-15]|uniref:autotransporter assembly complex protein TamB n=1 Tax=unclassified Avibacterium TaxID=2685287 RepID=UPI00202688F8|nr:MULTISPECIES: translocation/assembly module TamB domain-containing protein [unclassified Avibacterium]MCW9732864.1 translocation/assembly module TamB [Avibacterium sp. 20-15]URL05003.1 translocation/assembly module TamB [Avibacterium sp. 20-132]
MTKETQQTIPSSQETQHQTAEQQSGENQTEQSPSPKKKRSLWRMLLCLSAVIFLPIFVLLATLATSQGQRGLIQLVDKLMDSLSIAQIEGGLQNGLTLHNVKFQSEGVDTQVQQAHLQLDLACLLKAKICLNDLTIQQPKIQIDTSRLPPSEEKDNNPSPMKKIHLPVAIQVDNVQVQDLALNIDQTQINLAHFSTALSLNNESGFTLAPTHINDLLVQTYALSEKEKNAEKTAIKSTKPTTQAIDWQQLEQTLTPALLANLSKIELPFDLHITDIQGKNWQYQPHFNRQNNTAKNEATSTDTQQIDVPSLQIKADATGDQIQLQSLNITSSVGTLEGQGTMQLDEDFPLNFQLNSQLKGYAPLTIPQADLNVQLSGKLRGQTQLHLQSKGDINAELVGNVALNQEKTPFDLKLTSKNLQYPFDKKEKDPLKVQNVMLNLNGDLLAYHAQLNAEVSGMGVPKTQLTSQLHGKLWQVSIEQFELNALQGNAHLSCEVNWQKGVQWQSAVDFSQLNLTPYLPSMPALLSGNFSSQGQIDGQNWAIQVPDLTINGTLSRQPLSLKGKLSADSTKWLSVPNLLLNYGENRIAMQGEISQQSDLSLDIHAPNLRGLLPELSATLFGYAKLKGDIREPNLSVDLTGNNIRFQQLQLNKFAIKGDIRSHQIISGELNANVAGLKYADVAINQATLALSGDEKNHQLQLQSQGKPVAANLKIVGNFDRTSQNWKGQISGVDIQSPVGKWQTNQGITVNYNQNNITATVSSHCWLNSDVELCFPQTFTAGKNGEVPFQVRKLDLALINKLLDKEQNQTQIKGQLQSQGSVAWFSDKPLKLNVQVTGNHLSVAQKIDYRTFNLAIPKVDINAQMENNNLNLDSAIDLAEQGRVTSNLKLQDLAKSRTLGGSLSIHRLNLNLANQLLSSGEKVKGEIEANLTFGGNLNSPLIHGNFDVNHLTATMKSLPFTIKDGNLSMRFAGNRSTLQGYVESPESRLDITGNADWKDIDHWNTHVQAKADRFNVNIPSMAKLKISPNVELNANPKLLDISGTVDIPWARIAIEQLPDSAVTVSSDEVILDGPDKTKVGLKNGEIKARTKSGMEIRSDLKISIGNDVTLNAYGLNTSLNGLLSVKQDKGKLGLFGQIYLKNGRYAAYGQDLLIRKGQISFSGLPSQPMLNIEAIRNPTAMENSNITAGVKVIGLATAPQVTVFSDPASSQDEALSYLLTGRSLENSGEAGSGGSIGAALLGMGLAKSGKLVGGIGEAFGVQNLSLGTQGVGDSSKVTVSGNITPRLQLKYGVGLFDGLAEFTVRYKLLPQLYLQSVSGVNQAFDLLYHFEF